MPMTRAINARPPTTPPTIGPVLLLDLCFVGEVVLPELGGVLGDGAFEDDEIGGEELEDDGLEVDGVVAVELATIAAVVEELLMGVEIAD